MKEGSQIVIPVLPSAHHPEEEIYLQASAGLTR